MWSVSRPLQVALPFDCVEVAIAPTRITIAPPVSIAPSADVLAPVVEPRASPAESLDPLYFVRHRRARRYLLRVEPDGRLRVTIPRGGSKREAEAFAARNRAWVVRQRARAQAQAQTSSFTAHDRVTLRARAAEELPGRLRALADLHGVSGLTRISIRNQRTRWGSCGRDGHICLNWRLVLMPEPVRDYVLIHELMHLRRMDHSPAYWQMVAAACPTYSEARAWLRTHGRTLR
jgi:predicted metal-dependent hydrolase